MDFTLSDQERLLRQTVREFVEGTSEVQRLIIARQIFADPDR